MTKATAGCQSSRELAAAALAALLQGLHHKQTGAAEVLRDHALNRVLVQVIAQLALFLEFTGEDVLQLDGAVKQQEDMAFLLLRLTLADRSEFIGLLNQVADEWPDGIERSYLRSLPELFGIA
jgi:hypothetical protein